MAILFGVAPPPGQNPQLTPYTDLSRQTPLPCRQHALIVLTAVGPTGKGAIFKLLVPAILKGPAICLPSASQCESIDLAIGQTEELSYVERHRADRRLPVAGRQHRQGRSHHSTGRGGSK